MKKIVALVMVGVFLFLSCAHQKELTPEEKEQYRKANAVYRAGQRGGP
jgi:hypothetical protein